jgi:hypothetical protein
VKWNLYLGKLKYTFYVKEYFFIASSLTLAIF